MQKRSMSEGCSRFCPVFHLQSSDTAKLVRVAGYERQSVGQTNRGYLQIIRPDDLGTGFQIMPNGSVMPRGGVIKRQGNIAAEDLGQPRQPRLTTGVFFRAMPEFGLHHRAEEYFVILKHRQAGRRWPFPPVAPALRN
jgi:hypothetical protein